MIRIYEPGDGRLLREIMERAILEIGRRFYSHEQVRAWQANAPSAERLDEAAGDGRLRFIAAGDSGAPVAFLDLEANGHIDYFYCSPDAAGRGIGTALLDEAERHARATGVSRLFAEASEAALPLFRKKGFAVVKRRDLEVLGVAIHNYAVDKVLSA